MNKKRSYIAACAAASLILALAACGKANEKPGAGGNLEEEAFTEPVKLTMANHGAGITKDNLEEFVLKPLRVKYPNIEVELLAGQTLEQMIASGMTPDLIATSNYYLHNLIDLGVASDLNEFVAKRKTDLNRFEPETINVLKQFGKQGELYGIPFAMNYGILAYNKDIFDKFGVSYPKDQMTWNETIELAKRVTRKEGDTQYIGLDTGAAQTLVRAYSLPTVDEKQEQAVLATDGYKKVFSLLRQMYDIPGMFDPKTNYTRDNIDFFLKQQRVAMQGYWLGALVTRVKPLADAGQNFNWDLTSFPSFEDRKGVGREVDFHFMMITPSSKNKAAAYRVIESMITDEAQKEMNSGSRLTALNDPELRKQFASSMRIFEGKNLNGIFKVKPAVPTKGTIYDAKIYTYLNEAFKSMLVENADVNTALRVANEKANKMIEEEKQKAGAR